VYKKYTEKTNQTVADCHFLTHFLFANSDPGTNLDTLDIHNKTYSV